MCIAHKMQPLGPYNSSLNLRLRSLMALSRIITLKPYCTLFQVAQTALVPALAYTALYDNYPKLALFTSILQAPSVTLLAFLAARQLAPWWPY